MTAGPEGPCSLRDLQPYVPCVVLDPFCGAGTTGVVALRYGRDFIGIELNPEYAAMARRRIENDAPLFNAEKRDQRTENSEKLQPGLFAGEGL